MIAEGSPRHDPGWQSDPAVDAGFAAAYAGDPWQDHAPEAAAGPAAAPDAGLVAPAQPVRPPDLRPPSAPLARPRLREDRPVTAPGAGRRPPGRAVAGAAVSVGGVLLGIASLLWVTGEPPQPGPARADLAATVGTGAPSASRPPALQPVPAEVEVPPLDSPAVPAPAAPVEQAPVPGPTAPEPAAAGPTAPVVPVTVLNNSERDGLADRAARRFERKGWPVQATGNFRGRIPVTTVYYDPGMQASALAFAETFPGMVRVRPRFATLPARGVVVVLTRDYAA